MICKNCGNTSPDNSPFCQYCGAKLEPADNAAPASAGFFSAPDALGGDPAPQAAPVNTYATAPVNEAPAYGAAPAYGSAADAYGAPNGTAAPKKSVNKKALIGIIAGAAGVLLVVLLLVLLIGGKYARSPQAAMNQVLSAYKSGDVEKLCNAVGVDYRETIKDQVHQMYKRYDKDIDDLKDRLEDMIDEDLDDYDKWENRIDRISSENDAVSFMCDYYKAYFRFQYDDEDRREDIEDWEEELKDAEYREGKNKELKQIKENLKYYDDEAKLLFKAKDIKNLYYCEIDGREMAIVQTDKGWFVIGAISSVF